MMARLIAGLSFAHLALCYLYLYFLYTGFGGGVSDLFTATDVLSVGLGKLLPFYLMFLVGIVINHLWMMDKPFQIAGRDEFILHESLGGSRSRYFMMSIIVLAPAVQILAYFTGRPIWLIAAFFPLIALVSWLLARVFDANKIPQKYKLLGTLAFIGALQVTTGAYAEGFSARHDEYSFFTESPLVCEGEEKLLFTVGNYFVTVGPSGLRKAISEDCEEKLAFPRRVVTVDIQPL